MNADKFFTDEEKERIRQAIIAAESKTAGEIVPHRYFISTLHGD
jgi:uncharacterized membrane protein